MRKLYRDLCTRWQGRLGPPSSITKMESQNEAVLYHVMKGETETIAIDAELRRRFEVYSAFNNLKM